MTTPWGGAVLYQETTLSTMDDAQRLEDSGAPEGSLVWAGHQSAGRGRYPGRAWVSAPGASLLLTAFWDPRRFRVEAFAPSLTLALGVCLWIESLVPGASVALKWPNDVYLGDRKLAGILVRRRLTAQGPGRLHAGLGINLKDPDPGAVFRTAPVSLTALGVNLEPQAALVGLLPYLALAMDKAHPRQACIDRLWRLNQPLSLRLPDGRAVEGIPRGLDHTGALVLDRSGVVEIVTSAE